MLLLYQTEEAAAMAGWREILGGGGVCRYLIGANKRSKVRFLKHNVEAACLLLPSENLLPKLIIINYIEFQRLLFSKKKIQPRISRVKLKLKRHI